MGVHAKISERLAPRFKIVQISSRERLLGKYRIKAVPTHFESFGIPTRVFF